ncbi:MAG TPA: glycosyltransferase family 4 protein [Acidobacteriota bacterium]|nr:glycosyltransferase family 4 protein [Acidobacteriota bacterium]
MTVDVKKTIVVATGIYAPEIGGPATYLSHIVPQLQRMGHTVKIVTYGEPRDGCITVSRKRNIISRMYHFYRAVVDASKDADVIFATDIFSAGYPALRAAKKLQKRFVVRFVGDVVWETMRSESKTTLPFDEFQRRKVSFLYECARKMQRRVIREADEVLTVSRQLANIAKEWGSAHVTQVANCVDDIKVDSSQILRKKWGITQSDFVIASIGRLTNYKRVEDIIAAVSKAAVTENAAASWKLMVAGDGPQMTRLRDIASCAGVTFLGSIDQTKVRELLTICDVLVVASEYEGMSHTILEALALGKTVVASDVDGNTELLSDGHSGFIFPLGDSAMLSEILLKIADGTFKLRVSRWKPISHKEWLMHNSEVITR